MSKRWLSTRLQRDASSTVAVNQVQFDFDFSSDAQSLEHWVGTTNSPTTMFNEPAFRKKTYRSEDTRTASAKGSKVSADKRLQLTKVEDNWIGVAFGSPTNPPLSNTRLPNDFHTEPAVQVQRYDAPPPSSSSRPGSMSRYKKLGNLFRFRSGPISISAPTHVYKIDGDQRLDMQITRKPLPILQDVPICTGNTMTDASHSENQSSTMTTSLEISATRTVRPCLPRLEIQIPNSDLDRYSVMFRNVNGIKPSKLLERRSRNLQQMRKASQEALSAPPVPTINQPQLQRPTTPTHERKSSTYSLFPTPPKTNDGLSADQERQLPSRQLSYSSRPHTAPGRSSMQPPPATDTQPTKWQRMSQRKGSEISSISPDDTTASSDRGDSPWKSTESLPSPTSSRTSVGSEIFFDLKPAVDSDGREQSQYIIHQPDAPAVELAMSNSRRARRAKNKSRDEIREKPVETMTFSPDLQAAEHMLNQENKWRLSVELSQAIAEVERLTSPFIHPYVTAEEHRIAELKQASQPASVGLLPPPRFRKRLDGLAIGIPSPITERSEEFSPRLTPDFMARPQIRPHIASLSIRPAPLNVSSESIQMIDELAVTPPPVPLKDAKFIPMSKFAANSPMVKVVNNPKRRSEPRRSVTDSAITSKQRASTHSKKSSIEYRPSTAPHTTQEYSSSRGFPEYEPTTAPSMKNDTTILDEPLTEVSIARTVSLQRRRSLQITVSASSPSKRNSERAEAKRLSLNPSCSTSPTIHEDEKVYQSVANMSVVVEGTA